MSFQIGPLQEQWLQYLEQNPFEQISSKLGLLEGEYKHMCCLGAAGLICGLAEWEGKSEAFKRLVSKDGDRTSHQYLLGFEKIGLRSSDGIALKHFYNGKAISLAWANDHRMAWPEIASTIRADPENFFTESK